MVCGEMNCGNFQCWIVVLRLILIESISKFYDVKLVWQFLSGRNSGLLIEFVARSRVKVACGIVGLHLSPPHVGFGFSLAFLWFPGEGHRLRMFQLRTFATFCLRSCGVRLFLIRQLTVLITPQTNVCLLSSDFAPKFALLNNFRFLIDYVSMVGSHIGGFILIYLGMVKWVIDFVIDCNVFGKLHLLH